MSASSSSQGVADPTAYDALARASTVPREVQERAFARFLDDADFGLFADSLKLDYETGRVVHRKDPSLDLIDVMLAPPVDRTIKTRAVRVRLAAYIAQWLVENVSADGPLRDRLEKTGQSSILVKELLDTAMGIHATWMNWTPEAFAKTGLTQSACVIITHAVMVLYYLSLRDMVLDVHDLPKYLEDGPAFKDLSDSLFLLLVVSSPEEFGLPAAADTVKWIVQKEDDRSVLQNSVGVCLEAWLRADQRKRATNAMIRSTSFKSLIRLLLRYAQPESTMLTFSPLLPLAECFRTEKRRELRYPWHLVLIRELAMSERANKLTTLQESDDGAELIAQFRATSSRIDIQWPATLKELHESAVGQKLHSIFIIARSIASKVTADKSEESSNSNGSAVTSGSTHGSSENGRAKPKDSGDTDHIGSSPVPVTPPPTSKAPPPAPLPPPGRYGSDDKKPRAKVGFTREDYDHLKAAKGLIDVSWSTGVPWLKGTAHSSRQGGRLKQVDCFAKGGPPAPSEVVDVLTSLRSLPVQRNRPEMHFFRVPDSASATLAAAASARASLLAQTKRFKADMDLNMRDIARSAAFTLVTANRVQNMIDNDDGLKSTPQATGAMQGDNADPTVRVSEVRDEEHGASRNERGSNTNDAHPDQRPDDQAILRCCHRMNMPPSLAYTHVMIAHAINKRFWNSPS